MSHPHTVPKGWTRGEPLSWWGTGSRIAVSQATTPTVGTTLCADDICAILFDSRADLVAFMKWWHEGKTPQQVMDEHRRVDAEWNDVIRALERCKNPS